ncbi:MAG: hypothetical protein RI564_05670 [Gracilimonas sp.]|jgi:hypothetical protein|nr:hypothetical protein [Gracilimonas sp.]
MAFEAVLDPRAIQDIQEGIDYYDDQEIGLGEIFEETIHEHIKKLKHIPFFQMRYDTVRCLPVSKFPYMIHFTVNEEKETITVHGVINTHIDPKNWVHRG